MRNWNHLGVRLSAQLFLHHPSVWTVVFAAGRFNSSAEEDKRQRQMESTGNSSRTYLTSQPRGIGSADVMKCCSRLKLTVTELEISIRQPRAPPPEGPGWLLCLESVWTQKTGFCCHDNFVKPSSGQNLKHWMGEFLDVNLFLLDANFNLRLFKVEWKKS